MYFLPSTDVTTKVLHYFDDMMERAHIRLLDFWLCVFGIEPVLPSLLVSIPLLLCMCLLILHLLDLLVSQYLLVH